MSSIKDGQALSRRAFLAGGAVALGSAALATSAGASTLRAASRLAPLGRTAGLHGPAAESFTMYSYQPAPGATILGKMVAAYNKAKNANLQLNINVLAGSGDILYEAKIRSLLSQGAEPDVFQNWIHSLAIPYIEEGAVAPLTGWYKKYNWDKLFYKNAIEYVSYKGVPYGVPITLRVMPFWYRPSVFKKAGVGVPKTFEEFESSMAQIAKTGTAPIAVGEIYGWDLMRVYEYLLEVAAGPTLHDQLLNLETSWNRPEVADAFALLKKWGDNKWLLPGFAGTNPNDADSLFVAGRAAMDLTGGWEEASLQSGNVPEGDFDVFVAPTGHNPTRFSGFAEQWQISSKLSASQMDTLGDYFNWSLQPATARTYFGWNAGTATVGGLPAQKFPINAKIFELAQAHPTFTVMDEAMGQQIANAFFNIMDAVTKGTMTPAAAAKAMQAAANKYGKKI